MIDAKTKGNECFYNSVSVGLLPSSTHDLGAEKLGILARAYTKTNLVTAPFSLPFDVRNIKKLRKKWYKEKNKCIYTNPRRAYSNSWVWEVKTTQLLIYY